MGLPFTSEQFFGVFARYNAAVWPAPLVLTALAVAALLAVPAGRLHADRIVAGVLALLWAWAGVAYHWLHFTAINGAAWLFGALCLVQAALFVWDGVLNRRLVFDLSWLPATVAGALVIAYALVGYRLLGAALGHRYPAAPTFGVPCPTTLYTLGLLLLLREPFPRRVLVVPVLWAVVASAAAFALGVREDLGLLVAAAAVVSFAVRRRAAMAPGVAPRPAA